MKRLLVLLGLAGLLCSLGGALDACTQGSDGGSCVDCANANANANVTDGGAGASGAAGSGGGPDDSGASQGAGGQTVVPDPSGDTICNPGETTACSCLSCVTVTGIAYCSSDGKSFSECSCPSGC